LWGRVRRGFESARAEAQGSLAAFGNVLLILQADVAQNYFRLRALDAEIATVSGTVELRREQVRLVRSRFNGGIGNDLDIARAETELATTEAEAASLAQRRVARHRPNTPRRSAGSGARGLASPRLYRLAILGSPLRRPPVHCPAIAGLC